MERKRNHPTGLQRLMIVAASLLSSLALAAVSAGLWFYLAPLPDRPAHLTVETLSRMTPVKQQGGTQLCWAYAMLAAIETEHFREGDSLNLPIEPVVEALKSIPEVPPSRRAMGQTLLNLPWVLGWLGPKLMTKSSSSSRRCLQAAVCVGKAISASGVSHSVKALRPPFCRPSCCGARQNSGLRPTTTVWQLSVSSAMTTGRATLS